MCSFAWIHQINVITFNIKTDPKRNFASFDSMFTYMLFYLMKIIALNKHRGAFSWRQIISFSLRLMENRFTAYTHKGVENSCVHIHAHSKEYCICFGKLLSTYMHCIQKHMYRTCWIHGSRNSMCAISLIK